MSHAVETEEAMKLMENHLELKLEDHCWFINIGVTWQEEGTEVYKVYVLP